MNAPNLQFIRNSFGRLILITAQGTREEVVPIRSFPIAAPDKGISLVGADGHELAWIDCLADLEDTQRNLVEEELANREFVPEIRALKAISGFTIPSTWKVDTDRGPFTLVLESEDDIHRISRTMLLISDSNGIHFLVRDLSKLDRNSRKFLDGFL
jgi:uncharacterized ferredoxin-like protein